MPNITLRTLFTASSPSPLTVTTEDAPAEPANTVSGENPVTLPTNNSPLPALELTNVVVVFDAAATKFRLHTPSASSKLYRMSFFSCLRMVRFGKDLLDVELDTEFGHDRVGRFEFSATRGREALAWSDDKMAWADEFEKQVAQLLGHTTASERKSCRGELEPTAS